MKRQTKKFEKAKILLFWGLLISFLISCTQRLSTNKSKVFFVPKRKPFNYFQFGDEAYLPGVNASQIVLGKVLCSSESGLWVRSVNGLIKVKFRNELVKLRLIKLPKVYPHLRVKEINSAEVKLKIISLFPKIALFVVPKGECVSPKDANFVSPGLIKVKNLQLNKNYIIKGAVKFKDKIFGFFSKPLIVNFIDNVPPKPPSGGGYILSNGTLSLLWEKSPSEDVDYYLITCGSIRLKTTSTKVKLKFKEFVKECKVFAVDRAGNKSNPYVVKISIR